MKTKMRIVFTPGSIDMKLINEQQDEDNESFKEQLGTFFIEGDSIPRIGDKISLRFFPSPVATFVSTVEKPIDINGKNMHGTTDNDGDTVYMRVFDVEHTISPDGKLDYASTWKHEPIDVSVFMETYACGELLKSMYPKNYKALQKEFL